MASIRSNRSDTVSEEGFDVAEDLFDFDEVERQRGGEEIDLEEVFEALEASEEEATVAVFPDEVAKGDVGGSREFGAGGKPASPPSARPGADRSSAATAAPADPRSVPAALPPTSKPRTRYAAITSRSMLLVLLAVTSIHALTALVILRATGETQSTIREGLLRVTRTAEEIRNEAFAQAKEFNSVAIPVVSPDPTKHPTFDLVRRDIEEGRFPEARQRLYALLAIIDRLDPEERQEIESRATYMIARTLHLQAVSRPEASK